MCKGAFAFACSGPLFGRGFQIRKFVRQRFLLRSSPSSFTSSPLIKRHGNLFWRLRLLSKSSIAGPFRHDSTRQRALGTPLNPSSFKFKTFSEVDDALFRSLLCRVFAGASACRAEPRAES